MCFLLEQASIDTTKRQVRSLLIVALKRRRDDRNP